jgi:hypothetical protein
MYVQAVLGGSEATLAWLNSENEEEPPDYDSMCDIAAAGGHVKVLIWLQERGHELIDSVCTTAAQHGQIAVLEFALNLGLPGREVCTMAAEHNQLAVLMYAFQRGLVWDSRVCKRAAEKGHFSIMAYAHENGCLGSNCMSDVSAQHERHLRALTELSASEHSQQRASCLNCLSTLRSATSLHEKAAWTYWSTHASMEY